MKKVLYRFKQKLMSKIEPVVLNLSRRHRIVASLYFVFFNRSFHREHQAVIEGKLKHLKETRETKDNYFLLTRNTHRIEKGLLMQPRRPVFAKDYIGETLDSFERLWISAGDSNNSQFKWFHDVLEQYFATIELDEYLDHQYNRFKEVTDSIANSKFTTSDCLVKSVPYRRVDKDKSGIMYDDFLRLAKQRRSVRWFRESSVPRDLIDKAIMAANQSPSACNRQPYEFRIFDQPDLVGKLVNLPMGTRGYSHSIPVMAVLVGNLDAYFDERDRHVIYIDASLAAMSFMLALETMGLSSCAINWPDIEEREIKMDKFLKLEKHQRALMCIGLGYPDPDGLVAFSEKRPLDLIRKYNYE